MNMDYDTKKWRYNLELKIGRERETGIIICGVMTVDIGSVNVLTSDTLWILFL